ncbi:uncharacterized protein AMSG_00255 [Thecamonas trahens ATCC 50062]|uniref:EF-hand domain-containing protein n=1 Tax=Thecamonas trahens ATCC 50062 TaxID=461836 RepID=A0A0L0D1L6_THETB|nr:hypothetical protein AMSG_00255 [Thecamonas trahens ATCC 50062]KNC46137.1 hypothetical protein AMSG_00255 [Thecamonas trahens ATCC 50062]|eukprot:XP_013763114.1 hypothetical protein AMSG_00255 [Thecamonas trahens ATCC 50062]
MSRDSVFSLTEVADVGEGEGRPLPRPSVYTAALLREAFMAAAASGGDKAGSDNGGAGGGGGGAGAGGSGGGGGVVGTGMVAGAGTAVAGPVETSDGRAVAPPPDGKGELLLPVRDLPLALKLVGYMDAEIRGIVAAYPERLGRLAADLTSKAESGAGDDGGQAGLAASTLSVPEASPRRLVVPGMGELRDLNNSWMHLLAERKQAQRDGSGSPPLISGPHSPRSPRSPQSPQSPGSPSSPPHTARQRGRRSRAPSISVDNPLTFAEFCQFASGSIAPSLSSDSVLEAFRVFSSATQEAGLVRKRELKKHLVHRLAGTFSAAEIEEVLSEFCPNASDYFDYEAFTTALFDADPYPTS